MNIPRTATPIPRPLSRTAWKGTIQNDNLRGVRTGKGPVEGSYMKEKYGKGRRKLAGEKCPVK